ncbi:indolepyruvate ferredoxin oxidoreductase family protein [Leptothrix ochracea]|uniref:indolepyruvate ferredoxin oxidoreductase family protein n=1 Tax=Leptothrix ochracea TaxID=735331 RepID=UPI0034E2C365
MNSLATHVRLDDKYTQERGRVFMSGVQALVRLPMLQQQRDAAAGLHTAGFISGYRGSPLGGYDQALWHATEHLKRHHIVFQPGLNEELAATAVWGSQQVDLIAPGQQRFDGVFGLWYGKGPGVDRCADVFKHANMAGTARHGGVIAIAGDDHVAKSSTAAHQSDHLFKACGLPVFFPASVQEILDLGLHALALSRFSGLWAGMKTIQEIVESSTRVELDPDRISIRLPEDFVMPADGLGLHIRWPDDRLEQEARLMNAKWYAALAYIRANRLNPTVIDAQAGDPPARFGLMASGKAYNDTRQALADLGLDDARCRTIGLRLQKIGVVWPLEAQGTRHFAQGLREILVVEEKRQMIEYQLKEELYNWRADVRPDVLGKFDESEGDHSGGEWSRADPSQHWLLRAQADLNPALIARAIAKRLIRLGVDRDLERHLSERLGQIEARQRQLEHASQHSPGERPAWFCSGCPHNTSTQVPEGSRALAGIGCHYMVTWMDRRTSTFTQMGGEGVPWVGQAPFTRERHVFANLGDGTYSHSGLLAIRQSLAAGVNITYKILFNHAVAMTGGQAVEGGMDVAAMSRELDAEGVHRIDIVTDDPAKYADPALRRQLAPGTRIHPREALDALQRELRELPGCTVLIYDQSCANEKRRRIKRGLQAESPRQVLINAAVCEGCGDCSVQSNCLSIEPVETPFGRKRRINPSSCNKDFSCLRGFCPSFVTIEGGTPRVRTPQPLRPSSPPIPEPTLPPLTQAWGLVVAGIGGTGVITLGQVLGMAAHLEDKAVIVQEASGLAQKGGATWSHVQLAAQPGQLHTTKVDLGQADVVLAGDAIVATRPDTLGVMALGRTHVVLNRHATPTATFTQDADWHYPDAACETALRAAVGAEQLSGFDADTQASQVLGDAIYSLPMLLGYAWQRGWIPLQRASILQAIALNGIQVEANSAAFEEGRRCVEPGTHRPDTTGWQPITLALRPKLDALMAQHHAFLCAYQNAAYADTYLELVQRVRATEALHLHTAADDHGHATRLTEAVARGWFKLLASKDEFEVARLLTDPAFEAQIRAQVEGGHYRVVHHLAIPLLGSVKRSYGAWMHTALRLLAGLRGVRGTWLDPFRFSPERRLELQLRRDYRAAIEAVLQDLGRRPDRIALALEIARMPDKLRGYGHIRQRHWAELQPRWQSLLAELRENPS